MIIWLAMKLRLPLSLIKPMKWSDQILCDDLFQRLRGIPEDDTIVIVKLDIKSSTNNFKVEVSVSTPIAVCKSFFYFMVEFTVEKREQVL